MKGVAQWHGNSEARRNTITVVSGAMDMSRRTMWGSAHWPHCMLVGVPSVKMLIADMNSGRAEALWQMTEIVRK
jgi:hypothetical protein